MGQRQRLPAMRGERSEEPRRSVRTAGPGSGFLTGVQAAFPESSPGDGKHAAVSEGAITAAFSQVPGLLLYYYYFFSF